MRFLFAFDSFFFAVHLGTRLFVQVTHCGRIIELIPGGSRVPVTPDRVHEYVQLSVTLLNFFV